MVVGYRKILNVRVKNFHNEYGKGNVVLTGGQMKLQKINKQQIKTDRRIVMLGSILAMLCLVLGMYWNYRYRLLEPVFIENNQVSYIYPEGEGEPAGSYAEAVFYYITDIDDQRMISAVDFPQFHSIQWKEMSETSYSEGQYALHTLRVRLELGSSLKQNEWLKLTEATIFFSDGYIMTESIGTLLLVSENVSEKMAVHIGGSASSEGWNETQYQMNSDAVLQPKEIYGDELASQCFEITANGMPVDRLFEEGGLELKQGEILTIRGQWSGGKHPLIPLKGINEVVAFELNGSAKQQLFFTANYEQPTEGSLLGMWNYLKERGAFQ